MLLWQLVPEENFQVETQVKLNPTPDRKGFVLSAKRSGGDASWNAPWGAACTEYKRIMYRRKDRKAEHVSLVVS